MEEETPKTKEFHPKTETIPFGALCWTPKLIILMSGRSHFVRNLKKLLIKIPAKHFVCALSGGFKCGYFKMLLHIFSNLDRLSYSFYVQNVSQHYKRSNLIHFKLKNSGQILQIRLHIDG